MELKQYFSIVKKWWWLIVASTLVATVAGYIAVSRVPRVYQATTTAVVGPGLPSPSLTTQDLWFSQQLAQTYRDMVSRQPILEGVAKALNLPFVPWAGNVSARLVPGTQFLEISVRDTDPERARAIADEIARQLIAQTPGDLASDQSRQSFVQAQLKSIEENINLTQQEIQNEQAKLDAANSARAIQQYQNNIAALQQKLASYQSTYADLLQSAQKQTSYLSIFEPAVTPTKPISPRMLETVLMAAALGMILAFGGAFLIEFLDDTVETPDDIARATNLTTLGVISRISSKEGEDKLIAARYPLSPITEAFRTLRTNVQMASIDEPIHTLLVTSSGPVEGKSTIVANLAIVLAQSGKSVVVVDADLRRSALHKIFQVPNQVGLADALLQGEPVLDGYLQDTGIENLRLLTGGSQPLNPSELLGSQKMRHLIQRLKAEADILLFDTPPLLPVTDAAVLARETDGVLLVAEARRTRRAAIKQTTERLRQIGANTLGIVLNRAPLDEIGSYYYYYVEKQGRRRRKKG